MSKQIKIELFTLEKINTKVKSASRICFEQGCNNHAINSHILQKNGILSTITTNGHLYTLKANIVEAKAKFTKTGLNNVFTFKGFCNKHDTLLFDSIEKNELDISQYKTKVLLSYRAVLNELRKKQINIDHYNGIKDSSTLKELARRMPLDILINNETLAEADLQRLSNLIREDIDHGTESFHFATYSIPKVEVCTSATFNTELRNEMILKRLSGRWNEPVNSLIFNVIPHGDKTVVILGCHKPILDKCLYFFLELAKDPLKFISDTFIKNIETWVCSPEFYFKQIRPREKGIVDEFSLYPQQRDYTYPTRIYLFK
ncbi:hypothetical protein K3G63_10300 [Hymenobacter sp. HSC-4F20]|uniref:hypothetical protein n=1 Tax=Hymenobacter sp. HSC-4F20 TaxID=2864135 RepID=UPI001C73BE81|nr:hypothetical protein [Hymenobacter sp. HSC-4F20]MBX0290831.1 hypothetical protein [Hymenobacter sp. HSC-4F20]